LEIGRTDVIIATLVVGIEGETDGELEEEADDDRDGEGPGWF